MDLKQVKIALTKSREEWIPVRECFVKSFHRYPLYKYMVPDESKREAFLRAYLDVQYEITVEKEHGILLAVKVPKHNRIDDADTPSSEMKIIGGVLFVLPSKEGGDWTMSENDDLYWKAYAEHGLGDISKTGLERVIRYEAWENREIGKKALVTGTPLWNGIFCAIAPEYAAKGVGTTVYKEAIRIMAECWEGKQNLTKFEKTEKKLPNKVPKSKFHRYSLLNHKSIPFATNLYRGKISSNKKDCKIDKSSTDPEMEEAIPASKSPLVVAVTHNEKAVHFHQSNGFHSIARIPFYDSVEEDTPFYTHVLALDPFSSGGLRKFSEGFQTETKTTKAAATRLAQDRLKQLKIC